MKKSELGLLIHKFRSGTATAEERSALEAYWENAKMDHSLLDQIPVADQRQIKEDSFQAIRQQLGLQTPKKRFQLVRVHPAVYKVAASLLLCMSLAGAWYLTNNIQVVSQEAAAVVDEEVQTSFGERLTVILPDESSVVLNGNSRLRYAKSWSEDQVREVWIDGEGFFAVQHTKSHQKFIVHTREGLSVEVLGTKFNVKTRESGSEVLLTEGKVKLNVDNKTTPAVYLRPGELATIKEKKLSKRMVKEDTQYTSWVKSRLVFNKTPLEELAQILRETYGLQVSFQDAELKERQLSGEISSATADDILFAIAETFNIKVSKMEDGSVIFSSR